MFSQYARASFLIAGLASISLALMMTLSGSPTTAYAGSSAHGPQVIDTPVIPTDVPPTLPPAPPALTATPVATLPGADDLPRFADPYVFKSADVAQVKPGETIQFTIVAGNRGNVDAVNVQVRDTLPDYLDLVSVVSTRGTVSINGRGFVVDIGTIGITETITIRVIATGNSTMKAGTCTNVAVLNTTSGGNTASNDTSFANYVCGEVINPPTGGELSGELSGGNGHLMIALVVLGLLMIGTSFVMDGRAKQNPIRK